MNIESILLGITFVAYFGTVVMYIVYLAVRRDLIARIGTNTALAGFISHTAALIVRIVAAKRLIGYNFYEYMSIFAWWTVLIYLVAAWKRKQKIVIIGIFVLSVGFLLIGYASIMPKDIRPLVPALRSYWLQIHIFTTAIAYGSFTLSFGSAVIYLSGKKLRETHKDFGGAVDRLMSNAVVFGFPFLTIGILTGAIWAQYIWNSAWSWDPKETSSLITWLIYASYLHTKFARGWSGKKAAVLSIAGFLLVIFTYLGVDLLIPRAHTFLFGS